MFHDAKCEWNPTSASPSCRCAERTYLATATDEERAAFARRRGYDTNSESSWDLPPRRTA
jgi:hypothetical protein